MHGGLSLEFGTAELTKSYDPNWREPAGAETNTLNFSVASPQAVDAMFSETGEPGQCGWLKDKFGLSWQVVPPILGEMLGDKDAEKSQRVMETMLQVHKIDIAALKRAYDHR
jgi:predicted 3-demethylubiquinone-9 3-methyltransferase (glyoxalase superfamily)